MLSLLNTIGEVSRSRPIPTTHWQHFDLIYVHANNLQLTINHKSDVVIEEKRAILIYPGATFSGSSASRKPTTISVHHFSMSSQHIKGLPANLRQLLSASQSFVKFSRTDMVNDDILRLLKWEYRKNDTTHAFMLNCLMSLVMTNLLANFETEQPSPIAITMMNIDDYIQKNVCKAVTPSMLARKIGLSVNYFRVLFSNFFQMTPGRYINMIKMKEAARLLQETLLPVKAVARKVGFNQPSNFHRSFLRFYKITPREFRKRILF